MYWNNQLIATLKHAIDAYNRDIDRMKKQYSYDYTPNKTTLEEVMKTIHTQEEYDRRLKDLRDIQRKRNPDAWQPVQYRGVVVPKYLRDKNREYMLDINGANAEIRKSVYPEFEEMSPQERAIAMANGNISSVEGEYVSGDDLDDLIAQYYSTTVSEYYDNYLDAWREYCVLGSSVKRRVVEIIEWFKAFKPKELREIYDGYRVEKEIEYIYDASAYFQDLKERHDNILSFWEEMQGLYQ